MNILNNGIKDHPQVFVWGEAFGGNGDVDVSLFPWGKRVWTIGNA